MFFVHMVPSKGSQCDEAFVVISSGFHHQPRYESRGESGSFA